MFKEDRIVQQMENARSGSPNDEGKRFRNVGVYARYDPLGHVVPHHIEFEDERGDLHKFRISRVVHEQIAERRKSPIPEAGGIRYTVIFNDQTHVLYRVGDSHWFLSLTESY